jgi:hypothetical protein
MKTRPILLALTVCLALVGSPLPAAVICVDNPAALHTALVVAAGNNQANEIRVVQGKYAGRFTYASTQPQTLALLGGYAPNCSDRVVNPLNTRLDSLGTPATLTLTAPNMAGTSLIEGLSLRGGGATLTEGGTYVVHDFEILADPFDINAPRDFVEQQYRDFLGREGETAGIDYWTQKLAVHQVSRAQVVDFFFTSLEFQNHVAPVVRLYFAYFNRLPDYTGLMYWVNSMIAGGDLAVVSQAFATSPEFLNTYGGLDDGAFVDLVYWNVLGRAPEASGRSYWIGQLGTGLSRGALMIGFSESTEYRLQSYAEVQVTMMYVGLLRRSPEQSGFDFWVPALETGGLVLPLIDGFLLSAEYLARFE